MRWGPELRWLNARVRSEHSSADKIMFMLIEIERVLEIFVFGIEYGIATVQVDGRLQTLPFLQPFYTRLSQLELLDFPTWCLGVVLHEKDVLWH